MRFIICENRNTVYVTLQLEKWEGPWPPWPPCFHRLCDVCIYIGITTCSYSAYSVVFKINKEARKAMHKHTLATVSSQASPCNKYWSRALKLSTGKRCPKKCTDKQAYDPLNAVYIMHTSCMCKEAEHKGSKFGQPPRLCDHAL